MSAGERLEELWADNAATDPADRVLNAITLFAGMAQGLGVLPAVSPYHLPVPSYGLDVFRALLQRHIDFDAIPVDAEALHPMLVLGAVDVLTGRFQAFNSRKERITADSVLASAAIPNLFPAVHVGGGVFWDGLFSQNPPVRDLLDAAPDELWVIQVNPSIREREPTTVLDIADRRNELSGNLSLYQELSFIEKIDQLLEDGLLSPAGMYKQVVVRIIEMPSDVARLQGPASKLDRDAAFLAGLIAAGRRQARRFLTAYAFERAWVTGDVGAVVDGFTDDAQIIVHDPSGETRLVDGAASRRTFVHDGLCDRVLVDPVRKRVTGDQVTWSVRVRRDGTTTTGRACLTVEPDGISELRLHAGPA